MQALDCARRCGYPRMEAFSLASLGDLYVDVQMWEAAEELYRQAYGLARRIDPGVTQDNTETAPPV